LPTGQRASSSGSRQASVNPKWWKNLRNATPQAPFSASSRARS
jgi:hypothetical protein